MSYLRQLMPARPERWLLDDASILLRLIHLGTKRR
jgi:hypothetical protein